MCLCLCVLVEGKKGGRVAVLAKVEGGKQGVRMSMEMDGWTVVGIW